MSSTQFFQYINRASAAVEAEQVAALRAEVTLLWPNDPFAEELALALYSHELLLGVTRELRRAAVSATAERGAPDARRSRDRAA